MTLQHAQIEFDDQGRLISTQYDDIYFQPEDSRAESEYVFIEHGHVREKFVEKADTTIVEFGFGTGLNFLLTYDAWMKSKPKDKRLHYISFEKHPILKSDLSKIFEYWPDLKVQSDNLLSHYPVLTEGVHRIVFTSDNIHLTLVFGDIIDTLPQIDFGSGADIWFLDGFAPAKNPDMWGDSLWNMIGKNTKQGGRVTTFTAAGFVKRGLQSAGFAVEKVKGFGRKREMLVGTLNQTKNTNLKALNIAIIGAGIAGCAAAEALNRYGHAVSVFEKNDAPAMATSGNPFGAVYPKLTADDSPMDRFYRHAFIYTLGRYKNDFSNLYQSVGVFHMDRDETIIKRHTKIADRGLPLDLVQHIDPKDVEGTIGIELDTGGLFYPTGGYISPRDLCIKLLDGINIQYNTNVSPADLKNDFDIVIIASGTGLHHTLELPTEIVSGQITNWAGNTASHKLKSVLCHKGYFVPLNDSKHCLGATFNKGEVNSTCAKDDHHSRNMDQLFEHVPLLKSEYSSGNLTGRMGNRVATRDRLPVVGKIDDNLYVIGALGSHGLTTAPYLAECLASEISNAVIPADQSLWRYMTPLRFQD